MRSFARPAALTWLISLVPLACAPTQTTIASAHDDPRDQWSRGVYLYGRHCAGCHGEEGAGDDETPPLVGPGALPTSPRDGSERSQRFSSAQDVFEFVKTSMPPLEPDSVNDSDTWAILSVILKDNGLEVPDPLGPENASGVALR